jgi:hypothetical protein
MMEISGFIHISIIETAIQLPVKDESLQLALQKGFGDILKCSGETEDILSH